MNERLKNIEDLLIAIFIIVFLSLAVTLWHSIPATLEKFYSDTLIKINDTVQFYQ